MRHPFDVAWSPEASSSTPAFCSSSWYFAISPRIFSCGITPASESLVAFTTIMNRMVLSPLLGLRAQSLLLLLELRLERITEVVRLEHLANLHFTFLERGPFQPLDGLAERLHLPQPETGDQLLRLGEGPVDHRPLAPGEPDARALELACSPSPASITPAFSSSMLNFPISVRIFSSGRTPASESLLALTSTMTRIAFSSLFWVLPTRRASGGEIDGGGEAYPPAMAPSTKNGSAPSTTAAGSGASGDSWVRSRSQAKNRRNGRRCRVTWSRIVPRSTGYLASSASRMDARVTGPPMSSCTSSRTCARVRRWGGRTTRITAGSGPRPTARPGDPAQWESNCLPHRPTGTPARRWCRN